MHRLELRLTNEGQDDPSANFEIYTEALKDGKYTETVAMQTVPGGGAPIVMFLEANERVIVVAKANQGRMVFDKDQNANVRVETEAEVEDRKKREENLAKSQAQQGLRSAQAEAGTTKELGAKAQDEADTKVRQAQAEASKVRSESASSPGSLGAPRPSTGAPASGPVSSPSPRPGNPASANTGPIDSNQVKRGT